MARIAGVDIPNNKRVEIALTYIYGIGRALSSCYLSSAGLLQCPQSSLRPAGAPGTSG